ncbi:MAG: phosphotransferase [Gammaproteobacteria bacterium]|nr:phosphotransferase [Gammaproteobacteria bacterium]
MTPEPAVLEAYGLSHAATARIDSGLINRTWRLTTADRRQFVLQRVSPVFPGAVNGDIDVVTSHVAAAGLATPRIVPTRDGRSWIDVPGNGGSWRLMTWMAGDSRDSLSDASQAFEAGRLLGRFHRALEGLQHSFANPRLGVHDTARHLANLRTALQTHHGHSRFGDIEPLAAEILAQADRLPELPATPDRIVHGDPKINNMLFDPATGAGVALVDLDTVGYMPLPLELGDAFRSWCNPAGENDRSGVFSPELFRGALQGYREQVAGWITPAEIDALVPATLTIIVELAARFCADALNESYFGWDSQRFASRSEHNQVRAAGQLTLASSLRDQYGALTDIVNQVGGQSS